MYTAQMRSFIRPPARAIVKCVKSSCHPSGMVRFTFLSVILLGSIVSFGNAYNYHWEIDETPEGTESATFIQPVTVTLLDEPIQIPSHSASLELKKKFSVYLSSEWDASYGHKLLQTFESIPQPNHYEHSNKIPVSLWKLTDRHLPDDIMVEVRDDMKIVTIAAAAFQYAQPLLAEIESVRGRFFSKRLHRAVVRFVTDGGANRSAIDRILKERYAVSVNIPDYIELTKHTTREHAGRFTTFKNEELLDLVSMFEEFPKGMLKIPGLNYLVRRLDGHAHPLYPGAGAVAWVGAGYIEFMESAFKGGSADSIHRLILHEKAHFLWENLFDEQLRQDWIELGGWYKTSEDEWATTQQTEFVSAYAHDHNPSEDMAESIAYYIVRPDKLRSHAPAKYEFIQNRIMHGTRYISKIREDLTFEVYNLYPDAVYPGRIIRVDIQVTGEPEEDKHITVEMEIHKESELDAALGIPIRCYSELDTRFDMWLAPIDSFGNRIRQGHLFRGHYTLSRYAASGYWAPAGVNLTDAVGNRRYVKGANDFGWRLYINNPLADTEPPEYVKNSMRLSLSQAVTKNGKPYQIVTASWKVIEKTGLNSAWAQLKDDHPETYSRYTGGYGSWGNDIQMISANLYKIQIPIKIPDYYVTGMYEVRGINMGDIAHNTLGVYFSNTDFPIPAPDTEIRIDEPPATIYVKTATPDTEPPMLDVNQITLKAEPTQPEDPNGETVVDITYRVKDNISGYAGGHLGLRAPHGVIHPYRHSNPNFHTMYFPGDPTIYETYHKRIILPVGSIPGKWGLVEMTVQDKAGNYKSNDFTEIVRFEVEDETVLAKSSDVNGDGKVNILDLVIVAQEFGHSGPPNPNSNADINGDGEVNILDLVQVANRFEE